MSLHEKVSPRWLKIEERRKEVVVCSRVESWVSHWDPEVKRSRKCAGTQCALCLIGSPKVLRMVCMVVDDRGREHLLELRERHRAVAETIEATVTNGMGVRLAARKEGTAKNSPVTITVLGSEPSFRREIRLLVDTLGLPALVGPQVYEPEPVNVMDLQAPLKLR